jgi:serine/threonine protein kinase
MKWTTDEFTGKRFGKYEVLCRLAIGGMAEIFLGFARSGPFVGRPVVIKRILNEQREDPNAMQMLLDEAKMTATLSHPNVAQVMDLETADDEVLLVIEFISGANIEEIVEAYTARGEPVPLGFALSVIREAAQGLGHAHTHKSSRGEVMPIIHRDVTPRNVMVDFDGAIKVLDFGIARAKGSERRTQAGMVRGTTAYMSPEQAIGKEVDPRSDLFSLGTIFHELATGQRLFYKGNPGQEMAAVYEGEIPLPSKVNRRVPKALDTVVMRILERKIDKRYQSATDLIRDLSLAAGSTAWGKERCAELVRERFAARQKDVDKLLARIPNRSSGERVPMATGPGVGGPAYPEGRTIMARAPTGPPEDTAGARTMMGAAPLSDRRPSLGTDSVPAVTDLGRPSINVPRPSTPPPQPPASPSGLSAEQLFAEDDGPVPTRVVTGGSKRSLQSVQEQPTDPRRNAIPRPTEEDHRAQSGGGTSKVMLVVGALLILLVGGVGGAFLLKSLQPAPVNAVVRLVLSSDRPATVYLGMQELGTTPISVFVPSGHHALQLDELGGPKRTLDVNLPGTNAEERMVVTLDSLPLVP